MKELEEDAHEDEVVASPTLSHIEDKALARCLGDSLEVIGLPTSLGEAVDRVWEGVEDGVSDTIGIGGREQEVIEASSVWVISARSEAPVAPVADLGVFERSVAPKLRRVELSEVDIDSGDLTLGARLPVLARASLEGECCPGRHRGVHQVIAIEQPLRILADVEGVERYVVEPLSPGEPIDMGEDISGLERLRDEVIDVLVQLEDHHGR